MKIIIAPNAFKGCLSSHEVADAIESGIKKALPGAVTEKIPVSDGGDGLIDVLAKTLDGNIITTTATGPHFRKVNAKFFHSRDKQIAVIEMAQASGLALLKNEERNAMLTTSSGTGDLIKQALDLGAQHIYLGIGGSATNDAGMGIATVTGIKFYDKNHNELIPMGKSLKDIEFIDFKKMDPRMTQVKIEIICDVNNPLAGTKGAAFVYAPQKGASKEEVKILDKGLVNFANIISKQKNIDISTIPGGGAAGGIAAGMLAFFNARLSPGTETVLKLLNFSDKLKNADLIITAEGQIDNQTIYGKAPAGVAKLAKQQNIPCFAVAGRIGRNIDNLYKTGITSIFSICPGPVSMKTSMQNAATYIANTSEQIIRTVLSSKQMKNNYTQGY